MEFLAQDIEKVFPNEKKIRYYSPPLRTSEDSLNDSQNPKEAKGYLANSYRSIKKEFKKLYGEKAAKPALKRPIHSTTDGMLIIGNITDFSFFN